MTDDTRRRLEAAGRRNVPEPDPAFAERLEDRLRAAAAARPSPAAAARRWRTLRPGLAARLATICIVLATIVLIDGGRLRPTLALELTAATGAEVTLANGTLLVDPDGLLLPEGAVVRIGAGGSARIGEIALNSGDVATVVGGEVRVTREPLAASTNRSPDQRSIDPQDRSPGPLAGTPSPARPGTPASAPPATFFAGSSPLPDGSPAVPAKTQPPGPSATGAITDPRPSPAGPARTSTLVARAIGPTDVGVSWTAAAGAHRYVLVASRPSFSAAGDPAYPGSPVLGEFTKPPATPLVVRVGNDVREIRLLVVVLGADRTELSRSNVARVVLRD